MTSEFSTERPIGKLRLALFDLTMNWTLNSFPLETYRCLGTILDNLRATENAHPLRVPSRSTSTRSTRPAHILTARRYSTTRTTHAGKTSMFCPCSVILDKIKDLRRLSSESSPMSLGLSTAAPGDNAHAVPWNTHRKQAPVWHHSSPKTSLTNFSSRHWTTQKIVQPRTRCYGGWRTLKPTRCWLIRSLYFSKRLPALASWA